MIVYYWLSSSLGSSSAGVKHLNILSHDRNKLKDIIAKYSKWVIEEYKQKNRCNIWSYTRAYLAKINLINNDITALADYVIG